MPDFVIREWTLSPSPGDQAPLHVHHRGDEAFYVLGGRLDVQDGDARHRLGAGGLHVVSAGSAHTFATVGDRPVRLLVVMTPEIDRLIERLHADDVQDMAALWAEHHSSLVPRPAASGGGPPRDPPRPDGQPSSELNAS